MTEIVIYSGISGSGKSTAAEALADEYLAKGKKVRICSADHYFLDDDDNYHFDRDALGMAHAVCFGSFLRRNSAGN